MTKLTIVPGKITRNVAEESMLGYRTEITQMVEHPSSNGKVSG